MSTINANSVATPARRLENIEASWSLPDVWMGRDEGSDVRVKVRSMNGNTRALRGGDWVASSFGSVTLAVAWIHGKYNKKYGLTVAHAFTDHALGVGAFAYDSDEAEMIRLDGTKGHKLIKIGTVTSIDNRHAHTFRHL